MHRAIQTWEHFCWHLPKTVFIDIFCVSTIKLLMYSPNLNIINSINNLSSGPTKECGRKGSRKGRKSVGSIEDDILTR